MGLIPVSGSWRVQSGPCRSSRRTKLAPRNLPFWNIPDQNWQTTELESWTTYWFIATQELELELELEMQLVDWELGEHMLCGAPNCNRIPRSLLSQRWNANKKRWKFSSAPLLGTPHTLLSSSQVYFFQQQEFSRSLISLKCQLPHLSDTVASVLVVRSTFTFFRDDDCSIVSLLVSSDHCSIWEELQLWIGRIVIIVSPLSLAQYLCSTTICNIAF